jgi:hypothetical protein
MKLKKLTDLKVAKFNGITSRTLQNWKKPLKVGNVKYHLYAGKHNLYIGAKLVTYLLAYKENENETEEQNNNLENLLLSVEKVEKLVEIIKTECKSKYLEDLAEEIKFLKEKLEDLEKITKL